MSDQASRASEAAPAPPAAAAAHMAAGIERAAADLSLTEEPARFAAALEEAAPPAPRPDRD